MCKRVRICLSKYCPVCVCVRESLLIGWASCSHLVWDESQFTEPLIALTADQNSENESSCLHIYISHSLHRQGEREIAGMKGREWEKKGRKRQRQKRNDTNKMKTEEGLKNYLKKKLGGKMHVKNGNKRKGNWRCVRCKKTVTELKKLQKNVVPVVGSCLNFFSLDSFPISHVFAWLSPRITLYAFQQPRSFFLYQTCCNYESKNELLECFCNWHNFSDYPVSITVTKLVLSQPNTTTTFLTDSLKASTDQNKTCFDFKVTNKPSH